MEPRGLEPLTGLSRKGWPRAYRTGFAAHVWITTPEGRRQRKSVYGKTREEVHAKWLKLHEQARRGPVVPRSPTLATYLEGWLVDVVRPGLAPATAANYDLFVRLYIAPDLGRTKLEKLTARDVQVWLNQLRARCRAVHRARTPRGMSRGAARSESAASRSPLSGLCTRPGLCCAVR